jgi:hypothetical protein
MFKSIIRKSALALAAVSTLAAAPAFAGGLYDDGVIYAEQRVERRYVVEEDPYVEEVQILSPRQVIRELRNQGYAKVREISLVGDNYRAVAIRRNGALDRLKVDGETGEVLSARRIGWVRSVVAREPVYRHVEPGVSIQFGFSSEQ